MHQSRMTTSSGRGSPKPVLWNVIPCSSPRHNQGEQKMSDRGLQECNLINSQNVPNLHSTMKPTTGKLQKHHLSKQVQVFQRGVAPTTLEIPFVFGPL